MVLEGEWHFSFVLVNSFHGFCFFEVRMFLGLQFSFSMEDELAVGKKISIGKLEHVE